MTRSNPVAAGAPDRGLLRGALARLQALRALRWNYTRKGVWVWLKGRSLSRCDVCGGDGQIAMTFGGPSTIPPEVVGCSACGESGRAYCGPRGYQRILSEPERVVAEQTALAEGVFA